MARSKKSSAEPKPQGDGLDKLRAELARHGSQQMTPEEADTMQVVFQPRRPANPILPDGAPPSPPP